MHPTTAFRWLGVAGIELTIGDRILLIDPFFTRPGFLRLWLGRVVPDHALIASRVTRCDAILVTHAHYDHLMDVPDVARNTGATVFGSPNACQLLAVCGVPLSGVREIAIGDRLVLDGVTVDVLPGVHVAVPGFGPGPLRPGLRPPLRVADYRMDVACAFLLQAGELRLLVGGSLRPEQAPPADVLFVIPHGDPRRLAALFRSVQPRLVVPVHWDNSFQPLRAHPQPFFAPPRLAWPPLMRMDLDGLAVLARQAAPGAQVLVPEPLHVYRL